MNTTHSPYPHHQKTYTTQTSPIMSTQRQQSDSRGLGLYACSMPPHQPTVTLVSSPPTEEAWSQAPTMGHEYVTSQPPDIFSAAIDPFSGWTGTHTMIGSHSPEAPGLEFCQTPSSSNMPSHRGSVSSYAPSDGSDRAYTPRTTKVEEEWYPAGSNEHVLQRSNPASLPYNPSSNTLPSQTQDVYRHHGDMYGAHPTEWSKNDTTSYMNELHTTPDSRLPRFEINGSMAGVGRIKKKRQRTTPEEATHDCKICGKLFKRSYNWKSHMETHNPERKYPHPCTAMVGDQPCTKKFQRKTDLDRHFDSVHLKARNHKCPLCGNKFARRDTLRRHTEDGCPKRFELGLRDSSVVPPTQQQSQHHHHHQQQPATHWQSASPAPPSASHAYGPPRPKSFSGPVPQASSALVSNAESYPVYTQVMTLPPPSMY